MYYSFAVDASHAVNKLAHNVIVLSAVVFLSIFDHLLKCVARTVLHLDVQIYTQVVLVVCIKFNYRHVTVKLASRCLPLRLRL